MLSNDLVHCAAWLTHVLCRSELVTLEQRRDETSQDTAVCMGCTLSCCHATQMSAALKSGLLPGCVCMWSLQRVQRWPASQLLSLQLTRYLEMLNQPKTLSSSSLLEQQLRQYTAAHRRPQPEQKSELQGPPALGSKEQNQAGSAAGAADAPPPPTSQPTGGSQTQTEQAPAGQAEQDQGRADAAAPSAGNAAGRKQTEADVTRWLLAAEADLAAREQVSRPVSAAVCGCRATANHVLAPNMS